MEIVTDILHACFQKTLSFTSFNSIHLFVSCREQNYLFVEQTLTFIRGLTPIPSTSGWVNIWSSAVCLHPSVEQIWLRAKTWCNSWLAAYGLPWGARESCFSRTGTGPHSVGDTYPTKTTGVLLWSPAGADSCSFLMLPNVPPADVSENYWLCSSRRPGCSHTYVSGS